MAGILGEFSVISVSEVTKHEHPQKSGQVRSKIYAQNSDKNSKNSGRFRSATFWPHLYDALAIFSMCSQTGKTNNLLLFLRKQAHTESVNTLQVPGEAGWRPELCGYQRVSLSCFADQTESVIQHRQNSSDRGQSRKIKARHLWVI